MINFKQIKKENLYYIYTLFGKLYNDKENKMFPITYDECVNIFSHWKYKITDDSVYLEINPNVQYFGIFHKSNDITILYRYYLGDEWSPSFEQSIKIYNYLKEIKAINA